MDNCPADVLLVLDRSGSMGGADWDNVIHFAVEIVKGFKELSTDQTRVGVITFDHGVDTGVSGTY